MDSISFVVPEWMNLVSVPILIIALLVLDYCTAIWLQPTHIINIQTDKDSTTKEIFGTLAVFTVTGAAFGMIVSLTDVSFVRAFLVEFMILICLMWAFTLPKKLWTVTGACYGVACLIGELATNYNAVVAGVMMIVVIVTMLCLVITLGIFQSMNKK